MRNKQYPYHNNKEYNIGNQTNQQFEERTSVSRQVDCQISKFSLKPVENERNTWA